MRGLREILFQRTRASSYPISFHKYEPSCKYKAWGSCTFKECCVLAQWNILWLFSFSIVVLPPVHNIFTQHNELRSQDTPKFCPQILFCKPGGVLLAWLPTRGEWVPFTKWTMTRHGDYRTLGFAGTCRTLGPQSSFSQIRNVAPVTDLPMPVSFCSLSLPFQTEPDLFVESPLQLSTNCRLPPWKDSWDSKGSTTLATSTVHLTLVHGNINTSTWTVIFKTSSKS